MTWPARSGDVLRGSTVLLVEDESMISMLAEDVLAAAGCEVVLAMRQGEALEMAGSAALDFAVLDVNLGGGETSYPVADVLVSRRIPFLFATGYSVEGIEPRFRACERVQKPYSPGQLIEAAMRLREGSRA
jgi:CheY-like chemotaxis protein